METFRPPFPAGAPHHQLCPLCRAPHFPFCSPHQAPVVHPYQRFEGLHSGQQAPRPCPAAFNLHTGPTRRPPLETHLPSERPFEFPLHQSYFPQGNPPHFVDDRRDRVSFGQVQTSVPRFSVSDQQNHGCNGSLHVDPGVGARNAWIDPERDFAIRHGQMYAHMGENVGPRERFLPSPHNPDLPRLEGSAYMQENRIGRGLRDELYATPEVASFERSMAKQNHAVDSHTGAIQGRSRYETYNDALMDRANGSNHPAAHDAIQGSCDSHGTPLFDANRQQMNAKVYSIPGDEEERYQSIGMQRREEVALADQGLKREDGLPLQTAFRLEAYEHREEAQVRNTGHPQVNKGLKRKHGQQPLSREEELLIEKGLLDDESLGPQSHESFKSQPHYENEQFMPRYKQGAPFQQLTHPSRTTFPERETMATRFGEPDEHNLNDMLYLRSENQRNKRQEVEMGRGIPPFAGDRPIQSFIPGKPPMDATVDGRNHSQLVTQISDFNGAQTKNDILYRQYLEWESEERHMEALRRAERLAKEIQQRDDKGIYQCGTLKPEDSRNWEFVQDNTQKAYQQNQKNYMPERVECMVEHKGMPPAGQSLAVSAQNPQESRRLDCDIERKFQTAHCESQPWQMSSRDGICQDIQFAEPHVGVQKTQQDGRVQLSARSPHQAQWPKEQTPHQPQSGLQSVSRHDQPLSSLQSVHPLHQKSAVEEPSQEKPDRAPLYSFYNQPRSDAAHDLPDSFQPLIAAPVKPPPPDSPPPPLPPTLPPLYEGLPPPVAAGTFLSDSWTPVKQTADRPQQFLPSDIQGLQKSHVLAHSGVSQTQAHNHPHFQPQIPQSTEKSKIVDAVNIFRNPGRLRRPDRFVVIFRGLPGSGKSYLAKALRDVEVMNGGSAPRIHSMDDYFTCEVEKEEEIEIGSSRSKKKIVKRVMEYCYEPDMEEAYRASMLKAFKKTLEEGMFKFVIVDDRNVLIADFAQFWAIAKRSGYEVFIVEAPYNDVKGCLARNIHNFTEAQISSMSECWEATPLLYLKMDVSSLFRADDLNAQDIIEVDMDADDMERDLEDEEEESNQSVQGHFSPLASERPVSGERWQVTAADAEKKTTQLTKSRRPLLDVGTGTGSPTEKADNALSGLMTTYGKKDKFVHWSDNQGVKGRPVGFSIGSFHKMASLIIGPGPGYNGTSNLLVLEDGSVSENPGTRKNYKFVEQLRAEQEAFKAVFARRRQRILGMDDEDDD